MNPKARAPFVLGLLAATLCGSCDGGGDGAGGLAFDGGSATGANGTLGGTVVTVGSAGELLYGVDLGSGTFRPLAGNASLGALGIGGASRATLALGPDRSRAGGMLGTVSRCRDETSLTCVAFIDGAGRVESALRYRTARMSRVKRSHDGAYLAVMEYDGSSSAGTTLRVLSRAGDVVGEYNQYGQEFGSPYDWLPGGRLVFAEIGANPPRVLVSAAFDPTPERQLDLPARYAGEIEDIALSPDGRWAALTIAGDTAGTGRTVYRRPVLLEMATGALHEPVRVAEGEALNAQYATWSPDGRWLLFLVLNRTIAVGPGSAFPDVPTSPLFALRIDGRDHELPAAPSASTAEARMLHMEPGAGLGWNGGPSTYPRSDPVWLP